MKVQEHIQDLENLAENHTESPEAAPPITQLIQFWPIIRSALTLVKIFTGPKADAKINIIINWGDMLQFSRSISGK